MKIKITVMGIIASLCSLLGCNAQNENFTSVEVDDFEKAIAVDSTSSPTVVVDVRTPEEYAEGHIQGAKNIDVMTDDFEQKACAALPKDKTVSLYCRSGRRSKKAANILAAKGYKVVELNTGYLGWTGAGKPVVK